MEEALPGSFLTWATWAGGAGGGGLATAADGAPVVGATDGALAFGEALALAP